MKFIVQRVCSAACRVDDEVTGSIQKGFMVLIGISDSDTKEIADKMIKKLIGLRIFEDSEWKSVINITVYLICRLPEGKQAIFYRCR